MVGVLGTVIFASTSAIATLTVYVFSLFLMVANQLTHRNIAPNVFFSFSFSLSLPLLHLSFSLFVCFPNPFLPCRVVALLSLGSRGDAIASSFVPRAIVSLGIGVITST